MSEEEIQALINMKKESQYLKKSYNRLRNKYENQYVAIKNSNVIAHSKDIDCVINVLTEKKIDPASTFIEFLHSKETCLIL